jgi:hypothetical protein
VRVDVFVLFLILEEMLSVFAPFSMMLAMGLSYMFFIMSESDPSIPSSYREQEFYHGGMLNFIKVFLCIC